MKQTSFPSEFECLKNKQPIIFIDSSLNRFCSQCIMTDLNASHNYYQYKQITNNHIREHYQQLRQLNTLKDGIQIYQKNFVLSLMRAVEQITELIIQIELQYKSLQQPFIYQKLSISDLENQLNSNQKSNKKIKHQIVLNLLLDFKQKFIDIDFLHEIYRRRIHQNQQSTLFENKEKKEYQNKSPDITLNQIIYYQSQLHQLVLLQEEIFMYQKSFSFEIKQASQLIMGEIDIIESEIESLQNLQIEQQNSSDNLNRQKQNKNKINEKIFYKIYDLLIKVKYKFMYIDNLLAMTNQYSKKINQMFQYQLQDKKDTQKELYAFCFNKQNDILIAAGEEGLILTYHFQNGKIESQIQICKKHAKVVLCLYFMKKTNFFVSGSDDHSIKIWSFENNNLIVKQTFVDHQDSILCIIANSEENEIMSGSYDNTVKFWVKSNDVWNLSQSIDVCFKVYALSLNDDDDLLIICGSEKQIKVLKFDQNEKWKIFKVIITNEIGYRLCFTIKNQFVFQPKTDKYLEIYNFDERINEFHQKSKLENIQCQQCEELFPCQFIKKLNYLIVKHGQYLNVFNVCENGFYQWIQAISFKSFLFYGNITDDGQYLVTKEGTSKLIQVRNLQYADIM